MPPPHTKSLYYSTHRGGTATARIPSILTDEATVRELVRADRNLAERIFNYFTNFFNTLQEQIAKLTEDGTHESVNALAGDAEAIKTIADLFLDALEEREGGEKGEGVSYAARDGKATLGRFANGEDAGEGEDRKHSIRIFDHTLGHLEDNIRTVCAMESVIGLTGNEFPKGGEHFTKRVERFFAEHGNSAYNDEIGDVDMVSSSISDDIAHGYGSLKIASFAAIPSIIEEGKVVHYSDNWKGRGYDTLVIAAPISIGNEPYLAGVRVMRRQDTGTQRYYVHEVLAIEDKEEPSSAFTSRISAYGESSRAADSSSINSILKSIIEFKHQNTGVVNRGDKDIRYSAEQIDPIAQAISSADTTRKQVPALFKRGDVAFGAVNVDIGGGRFDLATDYLASEYGTRNLVFDPYNRSAEENGATLAFLQGGQRAETATVANVLNVIAEPEARANVILEAAKAIKPDGRAYFMVYEGDGSGVGRQTSAGWQNNRKTADYIVEVEQYFGRVERRGKLIVASEPRSDLPKASWEVSRGNAVQYSAKRGKPVTPEQDAAYMDAVERGDMWTAQRMVDEAAVAAGFEYRRNTRRSLHPANDVPWQMFVKAENGFSTSHFGQYSYAATDDGAIRISEIYDEIDSLAREYYGDEYHGGAISNDDLYDPPDIVDSAGIWDDQDFVQYMWDNYFEDVYLRTNKIPAIKTSDGLVVIGEDNTRVKSADPITYDDDGNVIPLSQRFNPDTDDIRYAARRGSDGKNGLRGSVSAGYNDGASDNESIRAAALSRGTDAIADDVENAFPDDPAFQAIAMRRIREMLDSGEFTPNVTAYINGAYVLCMFDEDGYVTCKALLLSEEQREYKHNKGVSTHGYEREAQSLHGEHRGDTGDRLGRKVRNDGVRGALWGVREVDNSDRRTGVDRQGRGLASDTEVYERERSSRGITPQQNRSKAPDEGASSLPDGEGEGRRAFSARRGQAVIERTVYADEHGAAEMQRNIERLTAMVAQEKETNESLRGMIDELEKQMKRTKGYAPKKKALRSVAYRLLKAWNSEYDKNKLTDELHALYDSIGAEDGYDGDTVMARACERFSGTRLYAMQSGW